MTSFESFPPAVSEAAAPSQHDRDSAGRAELLSELHATRLVLSRTEQKLETTRLELSTQASLRQAYEEARLLCTKLDARLQAALAEADHWKAEQFRTSENLRQLEASAYWRIGLRLKAVMTRHPLLHRLALRVIRFLRR